MGGVKKQFVIGGKSYQTQLKTEVFARFMPEAEFVALLEKYDAHLYRKTEKKASFVPTEAEMSMWQRFMDGTADQYGLAKETGKSSAAVMWLMAKVSRYALGKK